MEQWIGMETNPSSLGFDIIAASYWQLKDKKKALKFSQSQKEPEQTKFDFPGFTLKGCLGSELSKPKRQVAKLPSKRAQNYLKQLFPLLQSDNEDLVKAKDVLNKMKSDSGLTDPDKAQMYYYFAYIDSVNDDVKSAKKNYQKFLTIEDADPRLKSNVISMLDNFLTQKEVIKPP